MTNMTPSNRGISEKNIGQRENCEQNKQWLNSLDSGKITLEKLCVYNTFLYNYLGNTILIKPFNKNTRIGFFWEYAKEIYCDRILLIDNVNDIT